MMPRKIKFRKHQRGRLKGKSMRGNKLAFGDFGMKAMEPAWITAQQIEAARVAITRHMKRVGKVWINIFPHKPITRRPPETRMGKGKGNPEYWVAVVKPGRIMFEIAGVPENVAFRAMQLAARKLPIKVKFVVRGKEGGRTL